MDLVDAAKMSLAPEPLSRYARENNRKNRYRQNRYRYR